MPYRWTLTNLSDLTTEVLSKDPIGWDDGTYSIKRSEIYKGAFHEYTTSLKFHCSGGGKEFIDNIYQTEDIDGRIDVLLEYDCDGSGTYDELFNGIINLASYQTDGNYTTVNIEKSDLLTKLFSRDEISVDLESTTSIGGEAITAIDTTTIPMHSTLITYFDEWIIEDGYAYGYTETILENDEMHYYNSFNMGLQSNDIDTASAGSEYSDPTTIVFERSYISEIITFNEPAVIYPLTVEWEINFSGVFTDDETTGSGHRTNALNQCKLYWGKKNKSIPGSINSYLLYDDSGYSDDNHVVSFSMVGSGSITINHGDSIWIAWYWADTEDGAGSGSFATVAVSWVFNRSFFRITAPTLYKETDAKSVLVHEAFNQVVDSIADSDGNFHSDFYGRIDSEKISYADDGCGSLSSITNGLNIREFNRPILASFKSLFERMNWQLKQPLLD